MNEDKPDTNFTLTEEIIAGVPPVVVFVDPCEGCGNQRSEKVASVYYRHSRCRIYDYPEKQNTRIGGCAMDTRKAEMVKDDFKLNPLKASKRGVK